MTKHVTISLVHGGLLELVGEPMFDNFEQTLIVSGADGAYVQLNWQHIDFFAVHDK